MALPLVKSWLELLRRVMLQVRLSAMALSQHGLERGSAFRRRLGAAVAAALLIGAGCGSSPFAEDASQSITAESQEHEPPGSASGDSPPAAEESPAGDLPTTGAGSEDLSDALSEKVESTPREDVPSALRDRNNPDHPDPLVDLAEIRSGGVPPDAIPALEHPRFEPVGAVDWLEPQEPVLALEIGGDARAYPLRIMTWHELVNGTVGGAPVTVSYCPLCNSAVAYDRRVADRILDFGTSGELLNSSLVMYDRQTESLWSHFTGQAVAGHLTGAQLDFFPMQTVSFEAFAAAFPNGVVLSSDTGHRRNYGSNPYVGYDHPGRIPFLYSGPFDDRLAPMTRVLSVRGDGPTVAIPYDVLAERRVVAFTAGGQDLVALYEPGTASALDAGRISAGRDVGAASVFIRPAGPFALEPLDGGGFIDTSTGVVFNILGHPAAGDPGDSTADSPAGADRARSLELVEHLDAFWFAVAAFDPAVEIASQ